MVTHHPAQCVISNLTQLFTQTTLTERVVRLFTCGGGCTYTQEESIIYLFSFFTQTSVKKKQVSTLRAGWGHSGGFDDTKTENYNHSAEQAECSWILLDSRCSFLPQFKFFFKRKKHFTLLFSFFCFSQLLPFLLKFAVKKENVTDWGCISVCPLSSKRDNFSSSSLWS